MSHSDFLTKLTCSQNGMLCLAKYTEMYINDIVMQVRNSGQAKFRMY
jgi:hypothetical protein